MNQETSTKYALHLHELMHGVGVQTEGKASGIAMHDASLMKKETGWIFCLFVSRTAGNYVIGPQKIYGCIGGDVCNRWSHFMGNGNSVTLHKSHSLL